MNTRSFVATVMLVLPPASPAIAGVMPVSGTQSGTGRVLAVLPPGEPVEGSYSIQAPDPMASWSPVDQHVDRTLTEGDRWAQGYVDSTFASTILFDRVSLVTAVTAAALTSEPFTAGAECEYNHVFHLSFTLDAPTDVTLYAQIARNTGGWPTPKPFSLHFGRIGDAPLIDFQYDGSDQNYQAFLPPTGMTLPAGTYTVLADNYNFWGAGRSGQFSDFMEFDLRVVPSPGGAFAMGLGMAGILHGRLR